MTHELTHVTNTTTTSVTTFDNYAFNSMAFFAGKYLGASASGLSLLDDTDSTETVVGTMSVGKLSFGSAQQKRVENFYLAMRSPEKVVLRVSADENDPFEYEIDPLYIATLKQRRSLVGKGIKGKYLNFELECAGEFDYDTMVIDVVPLSRRL